MGLTSSTMVNANERDHFADIVNPSRGAAAAVESPMDKSGVPGQKKRRSRSSTVNLREGDFYHDAHAGDQGNNEEKGSQSGAHKSNVVKIDSRATIVKKLDCEVLWENFLKSSALSFALPQSEVISLLKSSLFEDAYQPGPRKEIEIDEAISKYLDLISELSDMDTSPKTFDFMAIVSSIMFLAPKPIEMKIDRIYEWITLKEDAASFDFDEFFVALSSFERGLSHAMGHKNFSEDAILNVSFAEMPFSSFPFIPSFISFEFKY